MSWLILGISRGLTKSGFLRVAGHKQVYPHLPLHLQARLRPRLPWTLSSASSLSSSLCVSLFSKEVGPREDGWVICPQLQVIQTPSNKWEAVDRNENIKRILSGIHMRSRDKIVPRHHKPLSANASGLHLLPVMVTEESVVVPEQQTEFYTAQKSRSPVSLKGRVTPLGSYSSPLDTERGAVESQACWCLLPPCGGSFLLLLKLPLWLLLYLCFVQFFETRRTWTWVCGRLQRPAFP